MLSSCSWSRLAFTGASAVCLTALALPVAAVSAAAPTRPYLSEVHYDNAGTDVGEFVEVHLPPGTSSAGLTVVLYDGGNGAAYDTHAVPVVTAPADAPAVAVVSHPANGVQNGSPDGVALVAADGTVLEFLSYEGVMTAADGAAAGRTSTDIGVAEAGSEPSGQSLSRGYDAATDALVWSGPAAATPGALNRTGSGEPEPVAVCDSAPTHDIGAVQGVGDRTPVAGRQVTLRGVVVGDVPGLSGFHLQDTDGDGDPRTSDGIFVFSDVPVDLGDTVAVTGLAQEFSDQTQVRAGDGAQVCSVGTAEQLPAPAALELPADATARERLEGMRVVPADTLTVSDVFDLTSFGELTLSHGGLLVQPTELARPGTAEAEAVAAENTQRRILLDDGVSARVSTTTAPYLSPQTPVRVGDALSFTEPLVLGYGFGQWRLQPADGTADGVFARQDTRPAAPQAVGGDLQVGAFNVLNYFLTFDQRTGRGARNAEQLERQADKIVPAVEALGAEVVTLMEIEDTDSTGLTPGTADTALTDLVRRLNAAAGYDKWAGSPLPDELYAVDRDVIRNAIIYQPAAVEPVGDPVGLVDESVWHNAREPIAQTFVADGDTFTVVANHLKSKSPGQPTGDNIDSGDGQGAWNGDRVRQARSLAGFAGLLRQQTADPDVLLMGDLNAYTQEDPVEALRATGFVDLGETLDPGRYSYVFDDMSGSLDHALATGELADKVTDLTHWNINAVESFAYQYSGDPELYAPHPYRSSDHDPLVLGIDLHELCQGREPTVVGTPGDDVLRGGNGDDVILGRGGDDVITGGNGDDVLCGGGGDDRISGDDGDDGSTEEWARTTSAAGGAATRSSADPGPTGSTRAPAKGPRSRTSTPPERCGCAQHCDRSSRA